MYRCESWAIKKAGHWRIDAFKLWCWRRLLRVSWTARRSNQSILKEISPEYSLKGLMLKLKFQYFVHLRQRANSLGKTLMLGKNEGRRRRGWPRMRLKGHEFEQILGDSEGQGILACCSPWSGKKSDTTLLLKNNNLLLVIYSHLSPYTFLIFLQNYPLNNNTFKNIYLLDSSSFLQVKGTQTTGKYTCILWKTFPSKLFPNCTFTEKEKKSWISSCRMPHYCPSQPQISTHRIQGEALGMLPGKTELPMDPKLDGDGRPGIPL